VEHGRYDTSLVQGRPPVVAQVLVAQEAHIGRHLQLLHVASLWAPARQGSCMRSVVGRWRSGGQ
jgi:hypothetical protein